MKKTIIIILLAFVALASKAQTKTDSVIWKLTSTEAQHLKVLIEAGYQKVSEQQTSFLQQSQTLYSKLFLQPADKPKAVVDTIKKVTPKK